MGSIIDDSIYPVHILDQDKKYRFLLSWCMNFDDALDVVALQTSLEQLLSIGDWRKYGSRLRLMEDGEKLECVVPRKFTKAQPALLFHHSNFSSSKVDEHPVGKSIHIRRTRQAFTYPLESAGQKALVPPHFPQTVDELVTRQLPQISLHVVSFSDATTVLVTWPHCMTDGPGHEALLRNWSLVLAGKVSEVSPLLGAREDILERLTKSATEAFTLRNKCLAIPAPVSSDARAPRRVTNKAIYLPAAIMHQILSDARSELAQTADGATSVKRKESISDADIMLAWFIKLVAASEEKPMPITALTTVNPRYRLPALRPSHATNKKRASGVYLQNMTLGMFASITATQTQRPVGEIALRCREQIQEHATEQQVLAFLKYMLVEAKAKAPEVLSFVDPESQVFMFNSLTPLNLATAVDFGPAVIGRETDAAAPRAMAVSLYCFMTMEIEQFFTSIVSFGKDYAGDFWALAAMHESVWEVLDEELVRLQRAVESTA